MKKRLNQNLINLVEYYNLIGANLFLSETPIKRIHLKSNMYSEGTKKQKLEIFL